ncbi:DNA polymerase eta [Mycena kentingensis (nom. inval.)]|nr:DNA polymerase eta [Mycena kentingensis (nom. inval.)]
MSSYKSFALIGAGTIGLPILRALVAQNARVVLLSRSESKEVPPDVSIEKVDDYADTASVAAIFRKHAVDVVLSTLPTSQGPGADTQRSLADAAKLTGIHLFVPSEFGMPEGVLGGKNEFAAYLTGLGIPWTRIYTGLFIEWIPWLVAYPETVKIIGDGNTEMSTTSIEDIAGFVAHVLTQLPDVELENRVFRLQGDWLRLKDTAELFNAEIEYVKEIDGEGGWFKTVLQKTIATGAGSTGWNAAEKKDRTEGDVAGSGNRCAWTMTASLWKGKQNADASSPFTDLNPTISYRTLLSNNLGPKDPLRVIALCDSDAFYAACEMVRLGVTDAPLVVLQWSLLIAVNYAARSFGITRMMSLKEAKERCPQLLVVHVATYKEGEKEPGYWENPDNKTHKVSGKLLAISTCVDSGMLHMYKDELPRNTEIEKASIDEAFFDLTQPVRQILLHRFPYLAQVPDDAPLGLETPLPPPPDMPWHEHSTVIPVDPSSVDNPNSAPTTWHDIALSIGAELMHTVRQQIKTKLGYTTSAGIARNKFLAKLCASHKKPMGQIRFLGGKLGVALADEYDVSAIADLLPVSLEAMQQRFGEESIWVGIDYSEVKEKPVVTKSMLAAKNLPQPITKVDDGYQWIRVLAAELALRLNEARETTPNLWPKTIVLHARNVLGDGRRSKQAPWPFVRDLNVDVVAAAADRLWRELVDARTPLKVTSVSLGFTGIEGVESGLKAIDTFFKKPASKRGLEDGDLITTETLSANDAAAPQTSKNLSKDLFSFICSRCGHRATLPPSATRTELERESALALLKMEHDDFHVALDLSRVEEGGARHAEPVPQPGPKKKKRKKDSSPQGIAKFFTRSS